MRSNTLNLIISVCTFKIWATSNHVNDINQFRSSLAYCEYKTLQLGSNIADIFNAPIDDQDWDERVHQDYIVEHLGFAPWLANGIQNSGGLTMTNENAKELHQKGQWIGHNISDSPYAVLNHKWIYMFGDSTTRQIWASFAAPFQGNNFERNAKEWSRHYCNKQEHRLRHVKNGFFPNEGWGGPCGLNEVTCHVSGYGEKGLLTFDWKHFPFEDYDEWFWGSEGPWKKGFYGESNRSPDILTIQFGLHSCWHASPQGLFSTGLTSFNQSMVDKHLTEIPKLMTAIRNATSAVDSNTVVIIVTSGMSGIKVEGNEIDDCILRFNRAAERSAHDHGFAVLERGEIERRIMYKSLKSNSPLLTVDMHLPQPAQNIVSTCLLHLIDCMNNHNITAQSIMKASNANSSGKSNNKHLKRKTPPARPLHSPQS